MKPPILALLPLSVAFTFTFAHSHISGAELPSPEKLLSEQSVFYLRFDGLNPHREGFEKTNAAQLIDEEFAPLLDELKRLLLDRLGPDQIADRLLEGAPPADLIRTGRDVALLPVFYECLQKNGFAVGVQLIDSPEAAAQVTLVFPNADAPKDREAFFAVVRLLAMASERKAEQQELRGRTILQFEEDGIGKFSCWQEGKHIVWSIGHAGPEMLLDFVEDKEQRSVSSNPLYVQATTFKDYETYARGFVDVQKLLQLVGELEEEERKTVQQLGLDGLTSTTFQFGFEDQLLRSTFQVDTTVERRGILKLLSATREVRMDNLPPLPPDAFAMGAISVEPTALLDVAISFMEAALQTDAPESLDEFRKQWKQLEGKLRIDIRRDLLDLLGPTIAAYTAASEGSLFQGSGLLIEVKDEAKLLTTLDALSRVIAAEFGPDVQIKTRKYRGVDLHMLVAKYGGYPIVPTIAVHNGWLVVGANPQVAQGLIFRSSGKYATWRPAARLSKLVDQLNTADGTEQEKKRVIAVGQVDPRSTVNMVLSNAWLLLAFASRGSETIDFDPSAIPNAQTVIQRLTPNISVVTDNGRSVRIDLYDSIPMPFDFGGIGFAPFTGVMIPIYSVEPTRRPRVIIE